MSQNDSIMEDMRNYMDDEEENDPEEYNVEAIRSKRRNPRTGTIEYFIKWENYPESQNSWEPIDNLKCPDLIARFNDEQKAKRKRKTNISSDASPSKRLGSGSFVSEPQPGPSNQDNGNSRPIFLEDIEHDHNSSSTEISSASSATRKDRANAKNSTAEAPQVTGFARGLPIEEIVTSSLDGNEKLWFFVRWAGLKELEMIESTEMEEKAPRELCRWYRERLFHHVKSASGSVIGNKNGNGQRRASVDKS